MKCKDIPTEPILLFVALANFKNSVWCNWCFGDEFDVRRAMPGNFGLPDKLVLAKMRGLIRRGLIAGCDCGCRGDYAVTDRGMQALGLSDDGPARKFYGEPRGNQRRNNRVISG